MNAAAWLVVLQLAASPAGSHAWAAAAAGPDAAATAGTAASRTVQFFAGGAAGLAIHEAGHVATAMAFDARPSVGAIRFGPIPFFAVRHAPVTRRREFVISSAGFWMQHASSEWLLTRRPRLRGERAPVAKGILAFNLGASAVYGVAAFGSFGPGERDTLGMARSLGQDGVGEAWVGALILAPAVLDGYRYLHPEARWAAWVSRSVKIAAVVLTATAGRSP